VVEEVYGKELEIPVGELCQAKLIGRSNNKNKFGLMVYRLCMIPCQGIGTGSFPVEVAQGRGLF
jgi:hypothetical protein